MNETPPPPPAPIDRKMISRIGIIGAVLGTFAIGLFLLLWILLGNAGISEFPRLVASVCVPPALMSLIFGIYFLTTRPSN